MKRIGHIFEKMTDEAFIERCIILTCKGKGSRHSVRRLLSDTKSKAKEIKILVESGFSHSEPKRFQRKDPSSGKVRDISALPLFPDQIIHRMMIEAIKPKLMKGMDPYCVGCVPGRGNGLAYRKLREAIRKGRKKRLWALQTDIRHFYPSIPMVGLMDSLRSIIKDERFLGFMEKAITIDETGLSIGVYSSPWLANYYLQKTDHQSREKDKVPTMVRNVDDRIIIGPNKRTLMKSREATEKRLNAMGLHTKPNWQCFPLSKKDVDFVGFRIHWNGSSMMRKRNWKRMRRSCISSRLRGMDRKKAGMIIGLLGPMKETGSKMAMEKYVDPVLKEAKANILFI